VKLLDVALGGGTRIRMSGGTAFKATLNEMTGRAHSLHGADGSEVAQRAHRRQQRFAATPTAGMTSVRMSLGRLRSA